LEFAYGMCGYLTDVAYDYDFRFQWRGVTVQEARVNTWCPDWDIHTLGVPLAQNRFGGAARVLAAIARMTRMPPPPPNTDNSEPPSSRAPYWPSEARLPKSSSG
jgi:hypothetical protein